jgi:hypothetical protein
MDRNAAETLFTEALVKVDSASIRDWAQSAHNRPLFVQEAQRLIGAGKGEAARLAVIIVSNAIGLW